MLEDLVDPEDEREVGESPYEFKGGDDEIVDEVRHKMAVERGEIIEVDSDSEGEEDNDQEPQFMKAEAIRLCQQLESYSFKHSDAECSLNLSRQLRCFRGHLHQEIQKGLTQGSLDKFFVNHSNVEHVLVVT